ncbi:hypothetical protein [Aquiflexum lacus]|uniref:hypothetical protein n=1 Tax=Aquiflexum lacus TaxID=2483805 RepID=UPI0018961264|nr:hypothetical protein [Aquiflexum lacus]
MEIDNYNSFVLERYRKTKFRFTNYKSGEFYFLPICKNNILNHEMISFQPKEDTKILPKMSFLRILATAKEFPETNLDKVFLINPIEGLEIHWLQPFNEFLEEGRESKGFEVMVYLERLVLLSPFFQIIPKFEDLKFYQAVYMICETDLPMFEKVTGCFSKMVREELNQMGIFLRGQDKHHPSKI